MSSRLDTVLAEPPALPVSEGIWQAGFAVTCACQLPVVIHAPSRMLIGCKPVYFLSSRACRQPHCSTTISSQQPLKKFKKPLKTAEQAGLVAAEDGGG